MPVKSEGVRFVNHHKSAVLVSGLDYRSQVAIVPAHAVDALDYDERRAGVPSIENALEIADVVVAEGFDAAPESRHPSTTLA